MADRLVVVDAGQVLQVGTPAAVWGAPNQAQVARLLGFTNVASAHVEDGRLRTPWGDLGPATGTVAAVLVRPDGVRPDAAGTLEGTVVGRTFAGAHTRVRVAVDGAPALDLDLPGPGTEAPDVGGVVRLRVAAEAVHPMPA